MENNPNYFITCFEKMKTTKNGWPDTGDTRTFGYYDNFQSAESALNENRCDMCEYLYNFAFVEEIGQGIHPDVTARWFFIFNDDKGGFFKAEEPEEIEGIVNFALG